MYEDRHGGNSSEYPPSQHLYPYPDYRDVSSHTRPDFAALLAKQQLMLEDIDSLLSKRTGYLREQDAAINKLEAQVDELKTIMDVEVPPLVQQVYFTYDDPDEMVTLTLPDCISPVSKTVCPYSSDSMHDLTDPYDSLHLSCQDDILQDSGLEPETTMDALVPPLVQQDEQPCQISSSAAYPWGQMSGGRLRKIWIFQNPQAG